MKKIYLLILVFLFQFSYANHGDLKPYWGKTGHRTVGQIAQQYLKNRTKRKIAAILDGQSLAEVATFADNIKSDRKYSKYYTWHYVNMPFDVDYQHAVKNPKGDLVTGIAKCKAVILDKNSTKDEKAFYLKMLVHLIGDLHQPLHVGRKEDKGANLIQVQWFGQGTNLHSVWDDKMINFYKMSYSELASNADHLSKEQIKFIQKGSIVDWVNETHQLAIKVYGSVKKGENLRYRYMYDYFQLVRSQLQKGGIRLAEVLNELFK
ncbi:MAG: S1/P1 nuclease [Lutibacter sp.]